MDHIGPEVDGEPSQRKYRLDVERAFPAKLVYHNARRTQRSAPRRRSAQTGDPELEARARQMSRQQDQPAGAAGEIEARDDE